MRFLAILMILAVLVTGCGAVATPTSTPQTPAPPAATATPRQPVSPISPLPTMPISPMPTPAAAVPPVGTPRGGGMILPGTEALVQAAQLDLAARLKLQAADITVKDMTEMEWPNSALGCPQPGMMYLQVITAGYRIVLTAQGRDYSYHTDRSRVVYCPNPS